MSPRRLPDLSVYLVAYEPSCAGRELADVVEAAARAGAGLVQLRDKRPDTRDLIELARACKTRLDPLGVGLVINDRVDVALAVGAAGVHVGQSDMHPADVRRLVGPEMILGLSAENEAQVREAANLDVDYLGIGPIYATATKPDAGEPLGPEGLAALCALARQPVVGIGSITAANAGDVLSAGAAGVAVISAICSARDVAAATRALARAVRLAGA